MSGCGRGKPRAIFRFNAHPKPRLWPRRAAMARFSAIDMFGAVPLNGFWNTRPISFARRCSGQRVMWRPASVIRPESAIKVPATAFSKVDFPEPFVPMMRRNDPRSRLSETFLSARTCVGRVGVEGLVEIGDFEHVRLRGVKSWRPV